MITAWADEGAPDAPPLLLLHSRGSDRTGWEPQARALAGPLRVLRVEARGHGRAPAPPGPYTLADLGGDVLELADALGLDTFHVAGISLGGLTALWLAVHHGDRLRSLTAANTAARVGSADGWQARIRAVRDHGLAGIRDEVVARFFAPGFGERDPATLAQAQAAFVRADADGYAACCAALADADLTADVGSITTPTLVVGGAHDVATPPGQSEELHAAIPGSRLLVLEDAAHLSNLEQPDVFSSALQTHIAAAEGEHQSKPLRPSQSTSICRLREDL